MKKTVEDELQEIREVRSSHRKWYALLCITGSVCLVAIAVYAFAENRIKTMAGTIIFMGIIILVTVVPVVAIIEEAKKDEMVEKLKEGLSPEAKNEYRKRWQAWHEAGIEGDRMEAEQQERENRAIGWMFFFWWLGGRK